MKINSSTSKMVKYYSNPVYCKECLKPHKYIKRNNKFCSASCGAIYTNKNRARSKWTKEARLKISNPYFEVSCKRCHKKILTKISRIFCSKSCSSIYGNRLRSKDKTDFQLYKTYTKFKHNIYDFPEEYDIKLIEECGWYKAKNKGDNLGGVSRDHIISCRYGFDNNIPTWIISHPANCQLMLQSINSSKNTKSEMSLDSLIEKIEIWNNKYSGS